MIVREEGAELLLFRQTDHAELAGELAARLLDPPPPVAAFVAAARLHDNGWREADDAPQLDRASGRPHTYMDAPRDTYRDVWERGIRRAEAVDPHVGLLVLLHGARFFGRAKDAEGRAFFERERARADALLRELELGGSYDALPDDVAAQSDWIAFLDGLSLFACERWASPWNADVAGRRVVAERVDEWTVTTRPWLFGAAFVAGIPARALPAARRFEDDAAMREAIARAPGRRLRFRFRPPQ